MGQLDFWKVGTRDRQQSLKFSQLPALPKTTVNVGFQAVGSNSWNSALSSKPVGACFRKIARKLHEDIAFRVLAASNFPAHRTIREFRALHLAEFTDLFVQVVRLASEMGLTKLGTIAVDGTKITANASRHKAMSDARMQTAEIERKAQIEALVQKAANADEADRNEAELDILAEIARR